MFKFCQNPNIWLLTCQRSEGFEPWAAEVEAGSKENYDTARTQGYSIVSFKPRETSRETPRETSNYSARNGFHSFSSY